MSFRFLQVAAMAVAMVTLVSSGADWPRWRGLANDGRLAGGDRLPAALEAEPKVLWEVPAGEGLASPVVGGGRVLAFDNQAGRETLRALDAATGRELWRADVDEPFSDSQGPTGPRNTPLIDGDRAYAVSCRGELQCRAMSDGALRWRVSYITNFQAVFVGEKGNAPGASRHGNDGSPLIDGPHLLALAGGTNGAGVVCLDKLTGSVVWKSTSEQAGYAPPVVTSWHGTPTVLAYTVSGLVGLRRSDGVELWRHPIKTSFARHVTTPIVAGDLVVVSSHEVGLMAVRVANAGASWTAAQAWVSKEAAINYASPVAVGGFLYGVGPAKDLICVELATGRIAWRQADAFHTAAGKAYAGMLSDGVRVLMLTDGGELRLFDADPAAYRETGRAQVCGANWCQPAWSEGILSMRDGLTKQGGRWKAVRLAPPSS
ncbi:MAG: PQQ-binding-like beta-propeller repeat protein [Verrucomicrobiales bacterium]|nr:PQQ-binding-like beta-propeller repeat protein [Verrucomicrobiales bacterium]